MYRILLGTGLLLFAFACSSSRPMQVVDIELHDLDTLFVEAPMPNSRKEAADFKLPRYKPAAKRVNDLLHTKLELSFDWKQEKVIGKASLDLRPYFGKIQSLTLDAKELQIKSIQIPGRTFEYRYDQKQIQIDFAEEITASEKYTVIIDYTAQPAASGGSSAITSNQGLFFINPQGKEGDKPQQIWTQGETEWNSRWFPTIDQPNERCTQELILTVEQRFQTLSNGLLKETINNPDGTRTDHWQMDQPHAPYLFMLAVGEFAIVKDQWRDLPLTYYVEPQYEASAKAIFQHTPEMLEFFSSKLAFPFPWSKYAQIVVQDYVSGAMENTTASVFGTQIQKFSRALIDDGNDGIVAHELFHQWFGDLVTCESWANLTMNEGFANYAEYLWYEHQYGADEAAYHLLSERSGYFFSVGMDAHPLIHFSHRASEDMFDAHSYNKGGAVLHMLRHYVGEEAFWTSLNKYLTDNQFQAVEAHNLRLAFEAVTGEDLNWFFNQWYFASGHPELKINYDYDATNQEIIVQVEQTQNPDRLPAIFQLPTQIAIYQDGTVKREPVWVNQRLQTFVFPSEKAPDLVQFDPDYVLLKEDQDNKTEAQLAFQFKQAPHFMDRYTALLTFLEAENQFSAIALTALDDPHWYIRKITLDNLPLEITDQIKQRAIEMVTSDPHSKVRAAALEVLNQTKDPALVEMAKTVIDQDSAYNVIGRAVQLLYRLDKKQAEIYVQQLENIESESIRISIAQIYAESKEPEYLSFFIQNLENVNGYAANSFYTALVDYLLNTDQLNKDIKVLGMIEQVASNQKQSPFRRLAATKAITDLANDYQARANRSNDQAMKQSLNLLVDQFTKALKNIKLAEKDERLRDMYRQLVVIQRQG
ncbi:MAG: M1 family metallopeptidase [Saprospiraceae bacterium]